MNIRKRIKESLMILGRPASAEMIRQPGDDIDLIECALRAMVRDGKLQEFMKGYYYFTGISFSIPELRNNHVRRPRL